MERRIAQNKKSEQEKKMREMAMNARIQRTAISKPDTKDEKDAEELKERDAIRYFIQILFFKCFYIEFKNKHF